MRIFSLLILLVVASALQSQVVVNENVKHSKYTFPLVASKIKATVCYDATTNNINSEKILIDTVVLVIQFYFFLSSK